MTGMMVFIFVLMGGFGTLGYMAWGATTWEGNCDWGWNLAEK